MNKFLSKQSLKVKLSLSLITMVLIMAALNMLLSYLFLPKYYFHEKTKALIDTFNSIEKVYVDGITEEKNSDEEGQVKDFASSDLLKNGMTEELYLWLEKESMVNSFSILVYRDIQYNIFDYMFSTRNKQLLYSSLGNNQNSKVESSNIYSDYMNVAGNTESYKAANKNYVVKSIDVKRLGSDYLYLEGVFKNGDHILIRTSMAGMKESVALSNRFFVYISIAVIILGFILMYEASKRFVEPITELTKMAKRMSELDFSAKYQVNTEDEVGNLGNSINVLSESLEEAMTQLKNKNAQLRQDLQQKEEVDQMRKEFLSNVSHELKTPIALIQGYAEGLIDNVSDDEESRQFYCEVIVDEAQKMNQMVKKLIALNQLEFGYSNVNYEYFDIADLLKCILDKSDILFKQKGIHLVFDHEEPVYVWSDAYMIEEVFTNYMTNAVNHVSDEMIIEVGIKKRQDSVRVSVFNSGEQIPEADLPNIWDKFYKVDKARTREYGGSGVGLSIVKASMQLLGQEFGAMNKENGVEFWFELETKNKINDNE